MLWMASGRDAHAHAQVAPCGMHLLVVPVLRIRRCQSDSDMASTLFTVTFTSANSGLELRTRHA